MFAKTLFAIQHRAHGPGVLQALYCRVDPVLLSADSQHYNINRGGRKEKMEIRCNERAAIIS